MRKLFLVLLGLALASPAHAGRPRPQTVLLPATECEGDYVLLAKYRSAEYELNRVACADLPVCVELVGAWPDSMIYGQYRTFDCTTADEFGCTPVDVLVPAMRDENAECPE